MWNVSLAPRRGNMWSLDPLLKQGLTPLCFCHDYYLKGASLVAQMVKCLLAMQESWVWSLGWEDPLEKEMATHSIILAWRIPRSEEPDSLQSKGTQRVGHDWMISLSIFIILRCPQRDKACLFTLFLFLLPFRWANRRLIVNASPGATYLCFRKCK